MKASIITSFLLFIPSLLLVGQTQVTFVLEEQPSEHSKYIGIRGDTPPLSWDKTIHIPKTDEGYKITLEFSPTSQEIAFKFVQDHAENLVWENLQNRSLKIYPDSSIISTYQWNQEQVVEVSSLPKIPSSALLEDFELIKTMVLEVHPGTYRYNSHEQIAQALEELYSKFKQPLTYGEAYLAISKLTATLACGHTKAGFNNQLPLINSLIHYQQDKVPFTFKWVGDHMILTHNASKEDILRRGTSILSMNGVPVKDIRERLLPYIGADGATDGTRVYKLAVNGYDFRYNAFDIFYPLLFPPKGDSLALTIQSFGESSSRDVQVAWIGREERSQILKERYHDFPATRDDMWKFQMVDDSIGVLSMNSFGLYGWKAMTLDYKKFLAETFKELREQSVPHLILDIRENTGGNDEMAVELFSYLVPYSMSFEREGRTRYTSFPSSLRPFIQSWGDNPWYYELSPKDSLPTQGYYIFKENFTQQTVKSDKKPYKGKVYLLSSAANESLAFYTAYRFQLQERGLIIGQETGGNLNDINGGQILFLRLPSSKIEIDFPVIGGFSLPAKPNSGVIPDISIPKSREDIANGIDTELAATLALIRAGK
ncbi:MAG: S41 family peptidase [Bacteroidota bacterium]